MVDQEARTWRQRHHYAECGQQQWPRRGVVYWHVDDVDAELDRAVGMGAMQLEAPRDRGHGFVTATVVDPFGNLLGIMYDPHHLDVLASFEPV